MSFFIYVFEFFNRIMGVNLGSCKASMPKEFLDGVQICPIISEVGSKTVTQGMGCTPRIAPCGLYRLAVNGPNAFGTVLATILTFKLKLQNRPTARVFSPNFVKHLFLNLIELFIKGCSAGINHSF